MSVPPRRFAAGDLLLGEDHDCIVNLYVALLRRWPDAAGYAHYLAMIAGHPERRAEALRAMAASPEAERAGAPVVLPEGALLPSEPQRAAAAMVELRTEFLQAEIARLRDALTPMGGGEIDLADLTAGLVEARDAELRGEIEAVRRDVLARLAALPGGAPPATAEARAAEHMARLLGDWVGELLGALEARVDARLRRMETRLIALEARDGSAG